jgi:hypothetical protein
MIPTPGSDDFLARRSYPAVRFYLEFIAYDFYNRIQISEFYGLTAFESHLHLEDLYTFSITVLFVNKQEDRQQLFGRRIMSL